MTSSAFLQSANVTKLSSLSARMNNIILTREQPWSFNVQEQELCIEAIFPMENFQAAYTVVFHCGKGEWFIAFSQIPPLKMHPIFADKPEVLCIPEDVKLAVLEIFIVPILKQFEKFIGSPVELVKTTLHYNQETLAACSIPLLLHLENGHISIPIKLEIQKREDALSLLEKMRHLPSKHKYISLLPIAIGLEAGYTNLSMSQLCALQTDDFLIPDRYFIQEGKVQLRFAGFLVDCKFSGGIATVMEVNNTEVPSSVDQDHGSSQDIMADNNMQGANEGQQASSSPQQRNQRQAGGQTQSGGATNKSTSRQASTNVNVESLELPVVFELERRFMTVHDIGALAPGYTFALSVDAQSPVTLRVNGRAIGLGRLVEINGTLGVQIIQLMDVS